MEIVRGDSRVSGYPGLSPKIQYLLLLHIDDWPVYMKFIIKCICQSEVRASVRFLTGVNCGSSF